MKECINCKNEILENSQFCSNCGQKVDENNLAVKAVTKEFFENYIALDTRFGRSLKPFLFKPGYLALKFIEGKRRSFANPFRLYIISSVFFFFCLTNYVNKDKSLESKPIIEISITKLHPFDELNKSEIKKLNKELSESTLAKLNKSKDTSFVVAYNKLKPLRKKAVIKSLERSSLERLGIIADTSLLDKKASFYINTDEDEGSMNWDFDMGLIEPYIKNDSYTDEMLFDTLTGGNKVGLVQELLYRQTIKFSRASKSEIRRTIFGNISLGMFILIPLFALFLKLLYRKRNKFYVAHLIHTVYLQSFAFVLFGMVLFLGIYLPFLNGITNSMLFIACIIFTFYFVKSMRKVYKQSRVRTVVKSIILFGIYYFLSMLSLVGEMLIAFLLF